MIRYLKNITMNNFKEPLYLVAFNSAICNYEIYINDFPAYSHIEGGSVSSQIPINQLIFGSGKQEIKIRIFPINGHTNFGKDSFIKIKIFCYDSSTTNFENIIESFNYNIENLLELKLPLIQKNDIFLAEVPYTLKKIDSLDEIKDKKPEIISFYKEIYSLFEKKNIQKIYDLLKFKFEQIDEATYSKDADNLLGLSKMLARLEKGNFKLNEFSLNPILIIYENKKVSNLVREDKKPILYFTNENNDEFTLPLLVSFETDKPFVIR